MATVGRLTRYLLSSKRCLAIGVALMVAGCQSAPSGTHTPSSRAPSPSTSLNAQRPPICVAPLHERRLREWLPTSYQHLIAVADSHDVQALDRLTSLSQSPAFLEFGIPITLGFALRNLQLELALLQRHDEWLGWTRHRTVRVVSAEHDMVWLADVTCDQAALRQAWLARGGQMLNVGRGFLLIPAADDPSPLEWFSPDGLSLAASARHRGRAALTWMTQSHALILSNPGFDGRAQMDALEDALKTGSTQLLWHSATNFTAKAAPTSSPVDAGDEEHKPVDGELPLVHWIQVEATHIVVDAKIVKL